MHAPAGGSVHVPIPYRSAAGQAIRYSHIAQTACEGAGILAQALVVAQQRDARLLVQLALLVGVGEAAAAPARLEQAEDVVGPAVA